MKIESAKDRAVRMEPYLLEALMKYIAVLEKDSCMLLDRGVVIHELKELIMTAGPSRPPEPLPEFDGFVGEK